MVTFPTPQSFVYSNFKGIRTRNGVNTGGAISAVVCQNVDFIPNTVGSDIQIKSTLGNVLVAQYPDFSLIKGFETVQDGVKHHLVYAETNGYSKEEFDLSKFTVKGSPTITEDGILTSESKDNYVTTIKANTLYNKSWEIISKFTVNSENTSPHRYLPIYTFGAGTQYMMFGGVCVYTGFDSLLLRFAGKTISGTSGEGDHGMRISFPKTMYGTPLIIKYSYDAVTKTYAGYYMREGIDTDWVLAGSKWVCIDENPNLLGTNNETDVISIGIARDNHTLAGTSVDLKQFSITVDGEEVFKGTKTVEYPEKGILLEYIAFEDRFEVIQDNLLVTGQANGITMKDTAYDVFIFTNGKDYYSVNFATTPITQVINPVYDGEQVTGLAMAERDGSLVIGQQEGFGLVIGSRQGDIYDWEYAVTADDKTKPWYQLFGKGVTALVPYIGGLLVFTADDSTLLTGNPADLASFERSDSSLGGCMSFESWCQHDKYIFFYDNNQKNIYYYTQIDTGQKILGTPIAPEVQKYFDDVKKLQMTGFIGANRSEIWLLADKFKLIYDYFIGEWSERVCQDISSYYVYDNAVYSTTPDGKILKEKEGVSSCKFDEVFYPATYTMQTINLGSYSNMKEMEMQPLFTVSDNNDNEFWVDCLIDGKKTKSKKVQIVVNGGVWGDDSDEIFPECQFDVSIFSSGSDHITHQLKGKFVSNWYYLQFTVRTEELGQEFNILAMELKGITMETDTIGRK